MPNPRGACPSCTVRDGCSGVAFSEIEGHCCKCIPIRSCVSLFTDTNVCDTSDWSSADAPLAITEAAWITESGCSREYAGVFDCGGRIIDFSMRFHRDEYDDQCYWALESKELGYLHPNSVGSGGEDSRLFVSMGSTIPERRSNCAVMDVTFEVELDEYGSTGRFHFQAAKYQQNVKKKACPNCTCEKACIRVFDGYTITTETICIDPYHNTWSMKVDDDDDKYVTIYLEENGEDFAKLSMESFIGDGETVDAACDPMSARWTFYDGSYVSIAGSRQPRCSDCKCYCSDLCVTYSSNSAFYRSVASFDGGYDGCSETFLLDDPGKLGDNDIGFFLECVNCASPSTQAGILLPDDMTLMSVEKQDILCPDKISASWAVLESDGETVATIEIECLACGEDCPDITITTSCCPDRRLPTTLYATIESEDAINCPEIPTGTVFTLRQQGVANALTACWQGFIDTPVARQYLSVKCEDGQWYASNNGDACALGFGASDPLTVVSCDPLELTGSLDNWGGCDIGVLTTLGFRITE